jgi:hypothetical protein
MSRLEERMPVQPVDHSALIEAAKEAVKAFLLALETASTSPPKTVTVPPARSGPAPGIEITTASAAPSAVPKRGRGRPPGPSAHPAPEAQRLTADGPTPKLLTLKELNAIYKISRPAAYTLINQGKLERIKIGTRTLVTDSSARALMVRA